MLAVVALAYEEEAEITLEERKKDLIDHRDDSTFSFDPATLNLKQLSKQPFEKKDARTRKGLLLASYSRKKTKKRKKGGGGGGNNVRGNMSSSPCNERENEDSKSRSVTPSPSPSPRVSKPQVLQTQRSRGLLQQAQLNQIQQQGLQIEDKNSDQPIVNTLHPMGYRGQLLPTSRQASSNASEGNTILNIPLCKYTNYSLLQINFHSILML